MSLLSALFPDTHRQHRVAVGETLESISRTYYGSPKYALVIFNHNRDILATPHQVYAGQLVTIPHIPPGARHG